MFGLKGTITKSKSFYSLDMGGIIWMGSDQLINNLTICITKKYKVIRFYREGGGQALELNTIRYFNGTLPYQIL